MSASLCLSRFRGPVQAVIFDWAGTIVDFGSLAPVVAFQKLFASAGVPIDEATARGPMGRNKRDHISDILLRAPGLPAAWAAAHGGRAPGEADVDALYAAFGAGKEPTDEAIAKVLEDLVPLSKLMSEQIAALRKWAKGRARPATTPEQERTGRKIQAPAPPVPVAGLGVGLN